MNEKALKELAVLTTVVGLLLLAVLTSVLDLEKRPSIETSEIDETLKIAGSIERLSKHENIYFLEIEGVRYETSQVIVFPSKELYLKEGMNVEITGSVEEYKGKKELIAETIIIK